MLTQHGAGPAMQAAVIDYFAGERSEIAIAIAVFVVVMASVAWLYISSRTGFALGLMITVVLFGGIMGAGLASLMIRDHASLPVLSQALKTGQYAIAIAIAGEKTRVTVVLSKFKYYRLGVAVLGAMALAGLMLSSRGWVHGVAAGLLLVVVAQVVIDHFSEQRARLYAERLTTAS